MSHSTSLSIPENVKPALVQLEDEVTNLEKALLELRQKRHEVLQHQLSTGIHNLTTLANSINTIAYSLESEILKFKDTAIEVNYLYRTIQDSPGFKALEQDKSIIPSNIWEINHAAVCVPTVIKSESQFILTVKNVDIHKEILPEREHPLLAETLK